jgi:hypothetical protein
MAGLVLKVNFEHQRKLSAKMKNPFSKVRHFINMQNVGGKCNEHCDTEYGTRKHQRNIRKMQADFQ